MEISTYTIVVVSPFISLMIDRIVRRAFCTPGNDECAGFYCYQAHYYFATDKYLAECSFMYFVDYAIL